MPAAGRPVIMELEALGLINCPGKGRRLKLREE